MPNRVTEAFRVLMGQRLTPIQIEAEWVEYQQIFRDLLETFSASLARQSKAEKKRVERLVNKVEPEVKEPGATIEVNRKMRKAELYKRMFGTSGRSPPNAEGP